MLVFLDTEFTDFAKPDLIRLALVAENGREFYAEPIDYRKNECSAFVRETVLPLLGRVPGAACTSNELADRVQAWFAALPEPVTIIFDFETDWHLLAVALFWPPQKSPPANFATPLFLDGYTVTHPVFEKIRGQRVPNSLTYANGKQ